MNIVTSWMKSFLLTLKSKSDMFRPKEPRAGTLHKLKVETEGKVETVKALVEEADELTEESSVEEMESMTERLNAMAPDGHIGTPGRKYRPDQEKGRKESAFKKRQKKNQLAKKSRKKNRR